MLVTNRYRYSYHHQQPQQQQLAEEEQQQQKKDFQEQLEEEYLQLIYKLTKRKRRRWRWINQCVRQMTKL